MKTLFPTERRTVLEERRQDPPAFVGRFEAEILHAELTAFHGKMEKAETEDDLREVRKLLAAWLKAVTTGYVAQVKGTAAHVRKGLPAIRGKAQWKDQVKKDERFLEVFDAMKASLEVLRGPLRTVEDAHKMAEKLWGHRFGLLDGLYELPPIMKAQGQPLRHGAKSALEKPGERNVRFGVFPGRIIGKLEDPRLEGRMKAAIKIVERRLRRIYPRILKRPIPIEVYSALENATDPDASTIAPAGAYYRPNQQKIEIGGELTRGPTQRLARSIAHELAHHLWRQYLSARDKKGWRKVWRSILPKIKGQYSATNEEEGFSEAFGAFVVYGPRALDPEVRHIVQTVLPGLRLESRAPAKTLFTTTVRWMLQEATEPTRTFDPHDPKTPRVGESKLVRLWRIEPKRVAVIERADGSIGVMVLPAGYSLVPIEAYGDWTVNNTERGLKAYFGRDLSALLHAMPKWHRKFTVMTGHHVSVAAKDLAHWYRSNLLGADKMPISSVYEARDALEAQGWQRVKHKDWGEGWKKVFAGTAILALQPDDYATELRMVPATLPRVSDEKWEQAKADLIVTIPVKGRYTSELEKEARELSARVKRWRPATKHDVGKVQWSGKVGEAALDQWKKDAERLVLGWFRASQKGRTTKALVDLVLHEELPYQSESLIDVAGITRTQMGKMITVILNRLARTGHIEKDTGGKGVVWYPRGA